MRLLRDRTPSNVSPMPDAAWSDAELVRRARDGDSQSFALLYRKYLVQIYDFCYHRLGTRELAEDSTQVVFLRAIAYLPQCRDEALFAGWLFAIARNVITDNYRSHRHETRPLEEAAEIEDIDLTPEEFAVRQEWNRELDELRNDCLNEKEQDLLDLRLQGLNDREISVALGRGYGAIRTAQYRLVMKLRECMGLSGRQGEVAHVD